MRQKGQIAGLVVLGIVLTLAAGLALWPVDLVRVVFDVDLGPAAAATSNPASWVATALVRVAGVLVASFAAMILATWTRSVLARAIFFAVGALSVVIVAVQWLEIFSFRLGFTTTVLCLLLVGLGFLALPGLTPAARTGT